MTDTTSPDEQLQQWLEGRPVHNQERDECCPDFSCCCPELLAPPEVRKLFVERKDLQGQLLMGFLGAMIAHKLSDKKVYIAGDEANYKEQQ